MSASSLNVPGCIEKTSIAALPSGAYASAPAIDRRFQLK